MCNLDPIKQLVEIERLRDVQRELARHALVAQLPKRARGTWRRPLAALGALLVSLGTRLETIGGAPRVAYHEIVAQK